MNSDLLFYVGLALLFTHELDAIKRHEWRLFPVFRNMEDDTAYYWFTMLHLPLLVALLWLTYHPQPSIRFGFQLSMDVFMVVHVGLHKLLSEHKKNEFSHAFSKALILAAGIVGMAHISSILWSIPA